MKKLSFLELEREMSKENRLITNEEELKAIEGGQQSSYMAKNQSFISVNNDAFSFKDTTVVNDRGMVHSQIEDTTKDFHSFLLNGTTGMNSENGFPTSTIPLNPNQLYLNSFVWSNFILYHYYDTSEFLSGDNVPVGYDVVSEENSEHFGQYHTTIYDAESGKYIDSYSWGVSYGGDVSGVFKSVTYISPGAVENFSDEHLIGTVGHEIVHDNNMRGHKQLYLSGLSGNEQDWLKFKYNSEYAAWKFNYKYYQSKGNDVLMNAAHSHMQKMAQEANDHHIDIENWDWKLSSGFISTTQYPSTTVPSSTLPTSTTHSN